MIALGVLANPVRTMAALGVALGLLIGLAADAQPTGPPSAGAPALSPQAGWHELSTEHARVLVPSPRPSMRQLAADAAAAAEEAYAFWKDRLGATPPTTPTIVLTDRGDRPSARLRLFPVPVLILEHPVPHRTDGWMTLHGSGLAAQIRAAYGKIVDQTRVGGFTADLRAVVGSISMPGRLKPLLWREGLALARPDSVPPSALPTMAARTWSEADAWPTLAELSTPHVLANGLPNRQRAGALGRGWLTVLTSERASTIEADLSRLYAKQPVIPLVADPLFAVAGLSAPTLYARYRERWSASSAPKPPQTPTTARRIGPSGKSLDPALSPDGTAVVYRHTRQGYRSGLRLAQLEPSRSDRPLRDGSFGPPVWLNNRTIAYPRIPPDATRPAPYDLYTFRIDTGEERRLTYGERIVHVAPFPETPRRLLVVRNGSGRASELLVMTLRPGEERVQLTRRIIHRFGSQTRVTGVDVSPDGDRFAIALRRADGGSTLFTMNRWGRGIQPQATSGPRARTPTFGPDGRWLLFASDRSGVPQIYALERATHDLVRLTDSVGGAFAPSVASESGERARLAHLRFGRDGFTVHTQPFRPQDGTPVPREPPEAEPFPRSAVGESAEPDTKSPEPSPYRVGTELLPAYVMPQAAPGIGAQTHNVDAVGRHRYDLFLGLQPVPPQLVYRFRYANRQLRPDLDIQLRGGPSGSSQRVTVSTSYALGPESHRSLGVGWRHDASGNAFVVEGALQDTKGIGRFERTTELAAEGRLLGTPQSPSYALELDWQERFRLPISGPEGPHRLELDAAAGWSDAATFELGGIAGDYPLRGAASQAAEGSQIVRANLDYRFPIWAMRWGCCGSMPWPVFLNALTGRLFVGLGAAGERLDPAEVKASAGMAATLDGKVGYGLVPFRMRAGLAYRIDRNEPRLFLQLTPRF